MSDEMIVVDETVQAERAAEERQRAYDAQQFARMGQLKDGNGNPVTVEQILEAHERGKEMKRIADAYTAQRKAERDAEAREAARVKAEKEAAALEAHATQVKAQKRADWRARGMGSDAEFEHEWRVNRHAFFPQNEVDEKEIIKRKLLASGVYR